MDSPTREGGVKASPLVGYGVHTSLKIPPNTWFRRLALGLRRKACHCVRVASRREEERRKAFGIARASGTLTRTLTA
ncbi:hypothetical protein [Anabaena sp. CCY 0017]|uniref:hypothetical protein n=1 Tax=Anabaena sp. CCY 0017 TaxID=3103866 RepID=UPI0039C6F63C